MSDNFANNSNMTALMTAIGNKIKAAGYTIYNAAGTALTRRSKLKFTGEAKATDDSVNGQTIVDVSPQYIDWDDWCAMTEQQQAAIPEAVIENAPGVEGGLSADLLTKLWENYDPNISFARQNITLASSDYDFLLIEYILNCTFAIASRKSVIVPKGFPAALDNVNTQANQTYVRVSTRSIRYTNNTTLQVDDALTQVSGAARETNNDYLIPTAIYGIKSSVNLKFSAIASDVSTSADKCMLSDGVTSVGDKIDKGYVEVVSDGTKTLTQLLDSLFSLIDYSKVDAKTLLDGITTDGTHYPMHINIMSSSQYRFTSVAVSGTSWNTTSYTIISSGSGAYGISIVNGTITYNDQSMDVITPGIIYRLIY